jgi:signal transduction histidine kinase
MLLNLLWNSVKFTPRGGRITVSTEASADRFMFVISDTGRGIAAEEISGLT